MINHLNRGFVLVHCYNEWPKGEFDPFSWQETGHHLINLPRYFLPATYTTGLMITRDAYTSVGGFRDIPRSEDLELGIATYLMYPSGISLVPGVTVEVSGRRLEKQYDANYDHAYRHGKIINI